MKNAEFKKRLLAVLCFFMVGISATWAQQTIKGTVIGTDDEPIIGANILEKGSTNGTVTDFDGNFTLSVKKGATLVISYIGYLTQEVQATPNMNIVLKEDSKTLDELIVVGYGVQKKSSITGSISKVDEKEMQNRTITSAVEALGGKTSGVQILSAGANPGANPVIRVRGYSSNYSSEPLYIVDGLKMSSIGNIDANDIESMEVLKDAASAAIYGAEAGNGVVLITTKKASAGRTKISYDFQYTVQSLVKKPEVLNAKQYIEYYKQAGYITDEMLSTNYDGKTDTNWADVAFENGLMSKHTLTFESANDKSSVLISLNYMDNNGIVAGNSDTYKRYNATMNASISPYKWLKLSMNANVGYTKQKNLAANNSGIGGGIMTAVLEADPLAPVYFSDPLPAYAQAMLNNGNKLLQSPDGRYYGVNMFHQSAQINPLIIRDNAISDSSAKMARVNFSADITPFKGMTITSRLGGNFTDSYSHSYSKIYYASAWANTANPTVSQSAPQNEYWQWENFANYMTTLGDHSLGVMVGASFSENINKSLSGSINDILKDQENYAWLNFATGNATKTISGIINNTRKFSYFGRLNYDYKNRYILEASMRADAADLSILPKAQRWGYFPAASLGWVVTNESWMPKTDVMTYMKLRASWGQNGSIANLGGYTYAASITSGAKYPFSDSYSVGSYPNALGNLNLKWETSEQTDFGVDFRFLQDRLTFSMDYYIKKTKDLLISGSTPSLTAGNNPSPINAGNVENKGFEFDMSWRDHVGDFNYSISANLSTLKNRVTYLDPTIDRLSGSTATVGSAGGGTYFEVGYPVWYMRGYTVKGIDKATGNPIFADLTPDGTTDAGDLSMIGSGIPTVNAGLTVNLAYKGFDMVIFGSGAFGGKIWYLATYNNVSGANVLKYVYDRRWTAENPNGTMARPMCVDQDKYYASSDYIFSGNYFKIKQVQFGYTVPKKFLRKTCFSNIRTYVSLDDFFCFSNYPGLDPETATLNTTNGMGLDTGSYPSSKKVVFGFNVSF